MKSFKRWWSRWNNPVQVGDIWEHKDVNPFASRTQMKVVEVKNKWAKCEGVLSGYIFEWPVHTVLFYCNLVEEQQ
jgi:hypothetical protein